MIWEKMIISVSDLPCYLAGLVEVVVTLLLLLTLVLGLVGGVTLLVVGVVALLHVIVHDLLHLLHLVHTPLPSRRHPCQAELDLVPALCRVGPHLGHHHGGLGQWGGLAHTVVGAAVKTEGKQ